MSNAKTARWSALIALALLVPAARADAIPPPEQLSDLQKTLIGIWHEDTCVMPQGLGHACLQRIYIFGNDSFAQTGLSNSAMSNIWATYARSGTWQAVKADGKSAQLKVAFADGSSADMTLALESGGGFTLTASSDTAMFPASHFSRLGQPVQPVKP